MKFKKFNFKKVKSTNDTAIRIIKNTNFKYGITFDGDGQNNAADLKEMIEIVREQNFQAYLGTRFKKKEHRDAIPFLKKIVLKLSIKYERLFYSIKLSDAHNGLRILDRDLIQSHILPIKNYDMSHATEISYKVCQSKCKRGEYPIKVDYRNKRSQNPINSINIAITNIFKPL